jgi:hypothetical protein
MIYTEPKESEREYRKFAQLGKKLGIPVMECFLEMEVTMPDGKRQIHQHKQRSHSWVRNAYNLIFVGACRFSTTDSTFGAGTLGMKDVGAVARSNSDAATAYSVVGPSGDDTYGILVGSGITAESFEGYALITKIANGTGAGQLSYVAGVAHTLSYVGGTKTLTATLVRYFNNNSGGNVDVNEIAIVLHGSFLYVITRDLLVSTVTIPDTGQLKVTYTINLVYPA